MRMPRALVLATVVAAAAAPTATAGRTHALSPCPAPPATYKPVPFDDLAWNWEIGQWSAACVVAQLDGPRKLAAKLHLSTSDRRTIATQYVSLFVKSVLLRVPASKSIAERIGLTRVQNLMVAGMLTGFRLRGRP